VSRPGQVGGSTAGNSEFSVGNRAMSFAPRHMNNAFSGTVQSGASIPRSRPSGTGAQSTVGALGARRTSRGDLNSALAQATDDGAGSASAAPAVAGNASDSGTPMRSSVMLTPRSPAQFITQGAAAAQQQSFPLPAAAFYVGRRTAAEAVATVPDTAAGTTAALPNTAMPSAAQDLLEQNECVSLSILNTPGWGAWLSNRSGFCCQCLMGQLTALRLGTGSWRPWLSASQQSWHESKQQQIPPPRTWKLRYTK
jgi:hypothetical protein